MTDLKRGNATQRGYDHHHRDIFRKAILQRSPQCVLCPALATVADHYPRSRRELVRCGMDPNDPQYGRALCKACHDTHTAHTQIGYRYTTDNQH